MKKSCEEEEEEEKLHRLKINMAAAARFSRRGCANVRVRALRGQREESGDEKPLKSVSVRSKEVARNHPRTFGGWFLIDLTPLV